MASAWLITCSASSGWRPMRSGVPQEISQNRSPAARTARVIAIVKLVDSTLPRSNGRSPIDVVEVAPGAAIILVGPSRSLRKIPWLKLAELSPGRHLLTVVPGTPIESLEIAILDLLEKLPPSEHYERKILDELRQLIGSERREQNISKF